jgi:hypothetical protein
MQGTEYPVQYSIERPTHYNRWTVAFRSILAIPQLLVAGAFVGSATTRGALGAVLQLLVLFAWFAILFTGRYPQSLQKFALLIFRWCQNVSAYVLLQAEPYPPFGEGPYPLRLDVIPDEQHNRWTVGFRLFLALPHVIVLVFLGLAQILVTFVAWLAILFTGQYPTGMFEFSVGVSRWTARVTAYVCLFVDAYPPFSLAARPGETATTAALPA